jgi:predicted AAA+ superfamily ATPase
MLLNYLKDRGMYFKRLIDLKKPDSSAFLFGPRMVGKTTLLHQIDADEYFDLLDPELELKYRAKPGLFWEEAAALPAGATIIIDEIQRVPLLLNYVQMGIDRSQQVFILSGSSARKLKRGGANLLGGRALDLKLHPLTREEIGDIFNLEQALHYGTLPMICSLIAEKKQETALGHLRSYVTTYIKEEIQAEAFTRNIGSFQRFLTIAAQDNGQIIEFANISNASSVPASTVKEYYQILEDTLIGFFLRPFSRSERKKARPKFYFFDCGVVRAIQDRLLDPPMPRERGFLFETWFLNELIRLRDYMGKPHHFFFWRERHHEIDIIVSGGHGPILALECKSGRAEIQAGTVRLFRERFPGVPLVLVSMFDQKKRRVNDIDVLPWEKALQMYRDL